MDKNEAARAVLTRMADWHDSQAIADDLNGDVESAAEHRLAAAALRAQQEPVAWGVVYRGNDHDWAASRPAYPDKSEYHAEQLRKHGYEALVVYTTPPPVAQAEKTEAVCTCGHPGRVGVYHSRTTDCAPMTSPSPAQAEKTEGCRVVEYPHPTLNGATVEWCEQHKQPASVCDTTPPPVASSDNEPERLAARMGAAAAHVAQNWNAIQEGRPVPPPVASEYKPLTGGNTLYPPEAGMNSAASEQSVSFTQHTPLPRTAPIPVARVGTFEPYPTRPAASEQEDKP